MTENTAILKVENLYVSFQTYLGKVHAVRNISFSIKKGETVGLVGESGCGKSVTALAIMGLISPPGIIENGKIFFNENELLKKTKNEMRKICGNEIGMIFQDPMTSLNPTMKIGKQIIEGLIKHQKLQSKEAKEHAIDILKLVGISDPEKRMNQYPHEFSGGMRQRVMIAIALVCKPKLLIADEPTTALDVTIQAQILNLMKTIQEKTGTSIIFITHDLGIVAGICDRVIVMYAGKIVECGTVEQIYSSSRHPYTIGLLRSIPQMNLSKEKKLIPIYGTPPNLLYPPGGCSFSTRCEYSMHICKIKCPPLEPLQDNHHAACWLNQNPNSFTPLQSYAHKFDLITEHKEINLNLFVPQSLEKKQKILLEIQNLSKEYKVGKKSFKAVRGLNLKIFAGETLGLVGESGCGKTTVGCNLLRLQEPTTGKVLFDNVDLQSLSKKEMKKMRRRMQIIFQDPYASLNPRMTVQDIVGEPLDIHRLFKGTARKKRIEELLTLVGLNPNHMSRFPHEFSGGQRQRVGIARALAVEPEFIICDEPISALDVSIQAQIINLLKKLQQQMGLTYLFIAHDLAMIKYISDRVAVMYLGQLVELATSEELYQNPLHPYTKALLSSIPIPNPTLEKKRQRIVLKGEIPNLFNTLSGCLFSSRCPLATEHCKKTVPEWREVAPNHSIACHYIVV